MIYKNGETVKYGDVIRWHCDDWEEGTTWIFTGIYHSENKIVYIGGGIDFGMGIGNIMTANEVQEEASNNDSYCQGIEKVGEASDIYRIIRLYGKSD